MKRLGKNEIKEIPWSEGNEYKMTPLPTMQSSGPFPAGRVVFIAICIVFSFMGVGFGVGSISGGVQVVVALFTVFGFLVTLTWFQYIDMKGLPDGASQYSILTIGIKEITYKKTERAGMPLMTTRIINEEENLEKCVNCNEELTDWITVAKSKDLVFFGVPIFTLEKETSSYCEECSGVSIGEKHQSVIV